MKKSMLCAALLLALGAVLPVDAKKPQDQEFRHVVVTLVSGEQVEGYLHRGWHAEGSLLKKENYSFKIVPTPESKEPVKYTADEVASVEYTEKTESAPDGIRWESHPIASPGLSDRNRTMRRMVCCDASNDRAALYWWKTWDVTTNAKGQTRRLITVYGIRFDDDEIVYPFSLVSTVLLKEKKPGLKEFYKEWFKGPEGKQRKKESKEDATWMLRLYDDYLAAQAR